MDSWHQDKKKYWNILHYQERLIKAQLTVPYNLWELRLHRDEAIIYDWNLAIIKTYGLGTKNVKKLELTKHTNYVFLHKFQLPKLKRKIWKQFFWT